MTSELTIAPKDQASLFRGRGLDLLQFLPAAVERSHFGAQCSELGFHQTPILSTLGVKFGVGKLRFQARNLIFRRTDYRFHGFQFPFFIPGQLALFLLR